MTDHSHFRLQLIVFALVSASFTNIYITQPVLPVLQHEFSTDLVLVSFTVSALILGIAISNLPFGFLADKLSIKSIIFVGGVSMAIGGWVGITCTGLALKHGGWGAVIFSCVFFLIIPLGTGIGERNHRKQTVVDNTPCP